MLKRVREEANLPLAAGEANDSEIAYYLNRGQDLVYLKIMQSDQKFFEQDELLSFVANQAEYDIPRPFRDTRITLVERLNPDGTVAGIFRRIRFQEKENWSISTPTANTQVGVWYPRERKMGFRPVSSVNESNAVRVYGIQKCHDMLYFKAQSVSGSTFVIPPSTDATNMLAGWNHLEIDYYKNAEFLCVSGTGVGTIVKGLSYVPTTRTLTLTAAASPIVTNDSLVLLTKIPEAYHETLIAFAVSKIAAKGPDVDRYTIAEKSFTSHMDRVAGTIEPRAMDGPEVIDYPGDEDDFLA